jgi:hypothetical protein
MEKAETPTVVANAELKVPYVFRIFGSFIFDKPALDFCG